jgi:hypothetical protein
MPKSLNCSKTEDRLPLQDLLDHIIRYGRLYEMKLFVRSVRSRGVRLIHCLPAHGLFMNRQLVCCKLNSVFLRHTCELSPILFASRARASKSYSFY